MRKRAIAAVLVGLSVCGLGAAAAQKNLGDGADCPLRTFFHGQIGRLMMLHSELDVTSDQREALHKIVQSHRTEIVAVAKPILDKRRALRDATLAKESNEDAIRSAANDLGK